jgi:bifunctional UDP-N-acetylglucosamine pyrophosphorylase / glucosamine-1-phosphate N-acetyltransferase
MLARSDLHVVILAAGQGTRMKSRMPKVLHRLAGKPLIEHVLDAAQAVDPATVTMVVGHGADSVRLFMGERQNMRWVLQEPQLGTAHALQQAEPCLAGKQGTLLLLSGDVPMLRAETLQRHAANHSRSRHGRHRDRRAPLRLRPNCQVAWATSADRRRTGCVPRGQADSGDQRRHLRL